MTTTYSCIPSTYRLNLGSPLLVARVACSVQCYARLSFGSLHTFQIWLGTNCDEAGRSQVNQFGAVLRPLFAATYQCVTRAQYWRV